MNRQDIVHLFNARGHAFLTLDHQVERIRQLELENAKLKELLREAQRRLTQKLEMYNSRNPHLRN